MPKKILITRPIPDEGLKLMRKKRYQLDIYQKDQPIGRRELLKQLKNGNYDAILSILTDTIDDKVLKAGGENLKVVSNYAIGYNNIDIEAAKERGITITNTPGPEISESVSEHVIALMFALAHRIVESDEFVRRGKYKAWGPKLFLGTDIQNKTIGIIGMGAIGTNLAKRLHDGFGLNIIYTDLKENKEAETKYGAKKVSQTVLLRKSDFVTLHVPLTEKTHHLINAKELRKMRKTAFLINTARGPVVEEKALIHALQTNQIAGAALDVYEFEPKVPAAIKKLPNVITTPHSASATLEARQAMSRQAAENIIAVLSGKEPKNKVI